MFKGCSYSERAGVKAAAIMMAFLFLLVPLALWLGGIGIDSGSRTDNPLQMAIKIRSILENEKPLKIDPSQLASLWPVEIAPYFEYEGTSEGFGSNKTPIPQVQFIALDGSDHMHCLGLTFSQGSVFINARFANPASVWFGRIDSLTTLVHEMAHNQGGDYASYNKNLAETSAQLAALEVLAAMANHGNPYARQALLDELEGIYSSVVEIDAVRTKDFLFLDAIFNILVPKENRPKVDKSMRYWSEGDNMTVLLGILEKYNVAVYEEIQDWEFTVKAEGDENPRTVKLDDLKYFLAHLNEKVQ